MLTIDPAGTAPLTDFQAVLASVSYDNTSEDPATTDRVVRFVADEGGTIWDTMFTVSKGSDNVTLEMQMDIKPHTLVARIMTRLIRGMVVKGVETDMNAVKAFCESKREQA